jgi:peptidoglycan/xylan/chitin deacetylase (PgdA/CDA1 family)
MAGFSSPAVSAATGSIPSSTVYRTGGDRPEVALTFDAGADAGNTAAILDLLASRGLRASFGVTGQWVDANPELARRIADEGHVIINHTRDHQSFTGASTGKAPLSHDQRLAEIADAARSIRSVTGVDPAPWFRPPYGDYDTATLGDVGSAGYPIFMLWSTDSLGWAGLDSARITARVLAGARPGAVFLFHVGSASADAAALPAILDGLRTRGLQPVTVAELLRPQPPSAALGITVDGTGTWTVALDGGVTTHGTAPFFGSAGDAHLAAPVVGFARTATGSGYWLLGQDGGVFSYGDATFHGSTGDIQLNRPVVGMAADPLGRGYWLVASDGGIFSFGVAFHGSAGAIRLNQPVVGMAATTSGGGYWLVARDGGVFSYGDAVFAGSTGDVHLNRPIVAMAADPDGRGYWFVAADGGVFAFDAGFYGSAVGQLQPGERVVSIGANPSGGYQLVTNFGDVLTFGPRTAGMSEAQ